MSTSYTRTRLEVARRVLGKVIKLSPNAASVASADLETVNEAIDLRLKEMHKLGIFWRKVTSVPVLFSLTGGAVSASAGAGDILFPIKMTWTNGDGDDVPVYIINSNEYSSIVDKTTQGNPRMALWKGSAEFMFYPVPSVNGTAKLLYEKLADDTTAGSAMDVDVSMIRAMIDIVKYDVADDYGISENIQQRWRAEARQAEIDIRKLGNPRTSLLPVAVDDFDGRGTRTNPNIGYFDSDYIE
jgi:hypothetical protein